MSSDNDNREIIDCDDDDEYRIYCEICDKLCIERHYINHLKSGTPINDFHKRPRIKHNY